MHMSSGADKTIHSDSVQKHKDFLFPAVSMYYQEPIALERGEGMYVWDESGNKYLDCFGGVLTTSVGHAHPRVTEAILTRSKSSTTFRRFTPTARNHGWRRSWPRSPLAIWRNHSSPTAAPKPTKPR